VKVLYEITYETTTAVDDLRTAVNDLRDSLRSRFNWLIWLWYITNIVIRRNNKRELRFLFLFGYVPKISYIVSHSKQQNYSSW